MVALIEQGMLLESAHGPIPNVAELVAGEPIRGSWWSHPSSHAIFDALNVLADSPDVVRTRLVNGKVTLIHRRLWPALVRLADRLPVERLAALHEEHTASGAHRTGEQPFPGGSRRMSWSARASRRRRGGAPPPDVGRRNADWLGAERRALLSAARRRSGRQVLACIQLNPVLHVHTGGSSHADLQAVLTLRYRSGEHRTTAPNHGRTAHRARTYRHVSGDRQAGPKRGDASRRVGRCQNNQGSRRSMNSTLAIIASNSPICAASSAGGSFDSP